MVVYIIEEQNEKCNRQIVFISTDKVSALKQLKEHYNLSQEVYSSIIKHQGTWIVVAMPADLGMQSVMLTTREMDTWYGSN